MIPSYFNPSRMNIVSARETNKGGTLQQLKAKDPEGDVLVLSHFTQDTGNTMMMPKTEFKMQFHPKGGEASEATQVDKAASAKLGSGLQDAVESQGLEETGSYNFNAPLGMGAGPEGNSDESINIDVVDEMVYLLSEQAGLGGAFL